MEVGRGGELSWGVWRWEGEMGFGGTSNTCLATLHIYDLPFSSEERNVLMFLLGWERGILLLLVLFFFVDTA